MWDFMRKWGAKLVATVSGRAREAADGQRRINEAEIAGAPVSRLRLWRSFLGWCLALCLVWEIMVRPVIMTYFPEITLPPSFLSETSSLLLSLLGI